MGIVSFNPPPHSRRGWNGIVEMEGILHKWTNYLSGWQPRYFVLDGAILSYYDSQDDVGKGSKGSIKMAVCEIKGHFHGNGSPYLTSSHNPSGTKAGNFSPAVYGMWTN
ncbi:PKHA3 protein, partial [Polypterus senegalus]|nr:PKHA3 protein [Polypterus senegalus]